MSKFYLYQPNLKWPLKESNSTKLKIHIYRLLTFWYILDLCKNKSSLFENENWNISKSEQVHCIIKMPPGIEQDMYYCMLLSFENDSYFMKFVNSEYLNPSRNSGICMTNWYYRVPDRWEESAGRRGMFVGRIHWQRKPYDHSLVSENRGNWYPRKIKPSTVNQRWNPLCNSASQNTILVAFYSMHGDRGHLFFLTPDPHRELR